MTEPTEEEMQNQMARDSAEFDAMTFIVGGKIMNSEELGAHAAAKAKEEEVEASAGPVKTTDS